MEEHTGQDSPAYGSFAAPDCPALNALLPAFMFHELIGCGDMGAVYRAQQISLSRDVAIKVLPPELSAVEAFARSFKVEARAMAKLSHPNLIGIYDFGEVAGMLYLVMEFIDGNVLHRSINGRKVEPVQAAEIVEGVARCIPHVAVPDPDFDAKAPSPATSWAPHRIYNIGNRRREKLMDMVSILEELTGREAVKEYLPMQPGDVKATWADVDALEAAVGFRPDTPLREGLGRFVDWYRGWNGL
jgi:nucleoside-diphosphate-sugar epimerase